MSLYTKAQNPADAEKRQLLIKKEQQQALARRQSKFKGDSSDDSSSSSSSSSSSDDDDDRTKQDSDDDLEEFQKRQQQHHRKQMEKQLGLKPGNKTGDGQKLYGERIDQYGRTVLDFDQRDYQKAGWVASVKRMKSRSRKDPTVKLVVTINFPPPPDPELAEMVVIEDIVVEQAIGPNSVQYIDESVEEGDWVRLDTSKRIKPWDFWVKDIEISAKAKEERLAFEAAQGIVKIKRVALNSETARSNTGLPALYYEVPQLVDKYLQSAQVTTIGKVPHGQRAILAKKVVPHQTVNHTISQTALVPTQTLNNLNAMISGLYLWKEQLFNKLNTDGFAARVNVLGKDRDVQQDFTRFNEMYYGQEVQARIAARAARLEHRQELIRQEQKLKKMKELDPEEKKRKAQERAARKLRDAAQTADAIKGERAHLTEKQRRAEEKLEEMRRKEEMKLNRKNEKTKKRGKKNKDFVGETDGDSDDDDSDDTDRSDFDAFSSGDDSDAINYKAAKITTPARSYTLRNTPRRSVGRGYVDSDDDSDEITTEDSDDDDDDDDPAAKIIAARQKRQQQQAQPQSVQQQKQQQQRKVVNSDDDSDDISFQPGRSASLMLPATTSTTSTTIPNVNGNNHGLPEMAATLPAAFDNYDNTTTSSTANNNNNSNNKKRSKYVNSSDDDDDNDSYAKAAAQRKKETTQAFANNNNNNTKKKKYGDSDDDDDNNNNNSDNDDLNRKVSLNDNDTQTQITTKSKYLIKDSDSDDDDDDVMSLTKTKQNSNNNNNTKTTTTQATLPLPTQYSDLPATMQINSTMSSTASTMNDDSDDSDSDDQEVVFND